MAVPISRRNKQGSQPKHLSSVPSGDDLLNQAFSEAKSIDANNDVSEQLPITETKSFPHGQNIETTSQDQYERNQQQEQKTFDETNELSNNSNNQSVQNQPSQLNISTLKEQFGYNKQHESQTKTETYKVRMSNEELEELISKMEKPRQISYTARYNPRHPLNVLTVACRELAGFTPSQSFFHNLMVDTFQMVLEETPELYDMLFLKKDECRSYSPKQFKELEEMMRHYILSIFKNHIK